MMTRTQLEWYANNLWRTSASFSIEENIGARILGMQAHGRTVEGVISGLEELAVEKPEYKAQIEKALKDIREGI